MAQNKKTSFLFLEMINISKAFFGIKALHDVSLQLPQGKTLGLIGENGAGKSTLMNVLGGIVKPDTGDMKILGEIYDPANASDASHNGIAFIHQELNLFTNMSIRDNFFITNYPKKFGLPLIDKKQMNNLGVSWLEKVQLDIPLSTKVESLQPGERQLVEIARALGSGAELIIFDEPTTSLTTREIQRLFDLIRQLQDEGKSIIYITHILEDVMTLCDEVMVLRDGEVVDSGPKKSYTINKMITAMVGRDMDHIFPPAEEKKIADTVLEIKNLSQPGLVHNIHLTLHQGEILGLFGLMGSGRSELASIIFGLVPYQTGEIILKNELLASPAPARCIQKGMAFLTENRREEGLMLEGSILENLELVVLPHQTKFPPIQWMDQSEINQIARQKTAELRIKCQNIATQSVKNLSGGNQQKVVIGKWLMNRPDVLILDEPTRGIDVGAKYEIYTLIQQLAAQNTGVLMISSEIEELMGTCDRICVMRQGEITGTFHQSEFDQENILKAAFGETQN